MGVHENMIAGTAVIIAHITIKAPWESTKEALTYNAMKALAYNSSNDSTMTAPWESNESTNQ